MVIVKVLIMLGDRKLMHLSRIPEAISNHISKHKPKEKII